MTLRPLRGRAPDPDRLPGLLTGALTSPSPVTLAERAAAFRGFTVYEAGWIHGTWYVGNKYRPSSYWGQFPGNLLQRVNAMFPVERMLHLCAGHTPIAGALNVDLMPVPGADLRADVEALPLADDTFAVALVDPPYSTEDATRYGVSRLVSSRKAMAEARRVLIPGGYLLWLDERYPAYRSHEWQLSGLIGVVTGFERRARLLSIFRSQKSCATTLTAEQVRA